jgi:hypothetical protein
MACRGVDRLGMTRCIRPRLLCFMDTLQMSDPESYAISAEMQLPLTERVTARALTRICARRTEMAGFFGPAASSQCVRFTWPSYSL